jgi:hypothetical protein
MALLSKNFTIEYGDNTYTDKSVLDEGKTLLIASQGVESGGYGFFDIPVAYQTPIITVPRTGSIGYAFVQLYPCTVTDDCLILTPKVEMSKEYLFYVASIIRRTRWRYNYGRKMTPKRISVIEIVEPSEFKSSLSYDAFFKQLYPKSQKVDFSPESVQLKRFQITELFELERGHFHAIDRLEEGMYPTVSRVSTDNGIVGFYDKPAKAKVFPVGTITVSTVTGDAFLQDTPFIATDNVVMCIPKKPYRISTLTYIELLLNKVKWRYSYGRQCYKGNFQKTTIFLPVRSDGEIDEDYIEKIVSTRPYWREFKKPFANRKQALTKQTNLF